MICSRWIAACVDVFDHALLDKGPYDRRSAWLWMIANATWQDRRINHKGKPIELKRGQLLAGRAFLADKWGWTEKQVRLFLDQLASETMIEKGQSDGHYANVVSICNYDAYQTPQERRQPVEGPVKGQSRASEGPVKGQTLTSATNTTNSESESAGARDGENSIGMGVFVNCETVRHRDFTINLKAIELQTHGTIPLEEIKIFSQGLALQWATEIYEGKRARDVVPDHVANFIRGSIQKDRMHRERQSPEGRKRASTPREQRSQKTKELLEWIDNGGLQ